MAKTIWGTAPFEVSTEGGPTFTIHIKGRDRWALERLMAAGANGCTPIDHPGPRWAAYVHKLRALGVSIETMNERHEEPFAGTHARYVLRSKVVRND